MSTLLDLVIFAVESGVRKFDVTDSAGKVWTVEIREKQAAAEAEFTIGRHEEDEDGDERLNVAWSEGISWLKRAGMLHQALAEETKEDEA